MAPRLASRDVQGVAAYLASDACQKVVVLTGAGVSCAAGIPDFRSPGGLYDTLRPELITASPQERAAMARDPTCVVLKDMFLQNQFPYHEVRRPFILGTQRQQWKATLFHRFLAVWKSTSASGAPDNSSRSHFSAMTLRKILISTQALAVADQRPDVAVAVVEGRARDREEAPRGVADERRADAPERAVVF